MTEDAHPDGGVAGVQEHTAQQAAELLAEALRRGFFGTAAVELSVQDGTIGSVKIEMQGRRKLV